jgi:hypothetical protein
MTAIEKLAGVQIYQVLNVRLTDFGHLIRDLEQALVLSGVSDQGLERALCHCREKIEEAAQLVRERPAQSPVFFPHAV